MTKELQKWADDFMFTAEKSNAAEGPKVYLLGSAVDPLGQIAACAKMYKGEVVRDLADVTDAERLMYLEEIQKTVLKMPLEAVSMHFMVEGVHRGITHQMVRQRTAAYAQESTRFAVKADMKEATALPPSLAGTKSLHELMGEHNQNFPDLFTPEELEEIVRNRARGDQAKRLKWDDAVSVVGDAYMELVNSGMPAEEARGLMPTNITTRLNYITNLRSFYETMAVRCSDQAQFEWRVLIMQMAKAMMEYGKTAEYTVWVEDRGAIPADALEWTHRNRETGMMKVVKSSAWQWEALAKEIKPVEFRLGKRAFGANFDRPSRIGERVDAFAKCGVPSSEWTKGSVEHGIPPIHPEEWLMDPNSARLDSTQEFDVFGNRVPKGRGLHWKDGFLTWPEGGNYKWTPEDA